MYKLLSSHVYLLTFFTCLVGTQTHFTYCVPICPPSVLYYCHKSIFYSLFFCKTFCICKHLWQYVIAKPLTTFVITHFIFAIMHLFINYFCCFVFKIHTLISFLYFLSMTFEPLKHNCPLLFLCTLSEHLALLVYYVLSPPKYPPDCGNYSHVYMTCFIFDNG